MRELMIIARLEEVEGKVGGGVEVKYFLARHGTSGGSLTKIEGEARCGARPVSENEPKQRPRLLPISPGSLALHHSRHSKMPAPLFSTSNHYSYVTRGIDHQYY